MSGSAGTVLDIQLTRGPEGLGFNILGGVDQQYIVNDSGIYVTKIKDNGAAAQDGRLQEGDKILEINGRKLENMSHSSVVEIFRSAGDDVRLKVLQRPASTANGPANSRFDGESSTSPTTFALFCLGLGVLTAAAFIYYSRRCR